MKNEKQSKEFEYDDENFYQYYLRTKMDFSYFLGDSCRESLIKDYKENRISHS